MSPEPDVAMYVLLTILVGAQATVIAFWVWQHVEMGRVAREGLRVPVLTAPNDAPWVTIIVPARDEAARIGGCVRSILDQEYPSLRLIIADDRSIDGTADVARTAASGDPRLSIHRIGELPPGWSGKSHALWDAAQRTDAPWLLFVDADCQLLPGAVGAAIRYASERCVDFLTLWPRDGSIGFWERLLAPLCGAMIVLWYGRRRVNDPAAPDAFANGQFILVRRDAYFSFGGHSKVRDAIIEDIPLARAAKAAGVRVLSALGVDVVMVRMYASLAEIVRGWRRIYVGVLSPGRIGWSIASIVVGSLAPYAVIAFTLPNVLRGAGGWSAAWLALACAHLVALMITSVRFFSLARCRIRYLWLYPLSCIGVLIILFAALVKSIGQSRIQWRGTTYSVEKSTIREDATSRNRTAT